MKSADTSSGQLLQCCPISLKVTLFLRQSTPNDRAWKHYSRKTLTQFSTDSRASSRALVDPTVGRRVCISQRMLWDTGPESGSYVERERQQGVMGELRLDFNPGAKT